MTDLRATLGTNQTLQGALYSPNSLTGHLAEPTQLQAHLTVAGTAGNDLTLRGTLSTPGSLSGALSEPQQLRGAVTTAVSYSVVPPASSSSLGGVIVGADLLITEEGVLSVDKATDITGDNTRPVTAAAVYVEIGNINALLHTI